MESADNPELVPESTASGQFDKYANDGMWPEYCNPAYRMPDEIEVKVAMGSGDYYFPVSIVKAASSKTYLGGYRNKINGKIYHHANSQTPPEQKKTFKAYSNLTSRETQTYESRSLSIQCHRECGTQMERVDLRLDNKRDMEISPKKYTTASELMILKKAKSIEIQRLWRGFMARCAANRIRRRNIELEKAAREEREARLLRNKEERMADMTRRMHPKTQGDFAILYNELDTWRQAEIARIKESTSPGEERVEAMNALLENETKALQSIQKLKLSSQKSLHSERTQTMLENMAQPQKWQLSTGDVCAVTTPASIRAKELLELYKALGAPMSSIDERLDVLLHVKWTVKEFAGQLSQDISDLVDREADLLNRGRPAKSMERLRERLGNLFLQFLENPDFNPRAAEFTRLPPMRSS